MRFFPQGASQSTAVRWFITVHVGLALLLFHIAQAVGDGHPDEPMPPLHLAKTPELTEAHRPDPTAERVALHTPSHPAQHPSLPQPE